jgi:mycothiol S-conjugate amidase
MSEPLCVLTVHAHPDDEASKGAPTLAKYKAQGVRTVLVTCTGGEEGDIQNPAMDLPEVRADIASVRMEELAAAADIIGFDEVVLLGYRDSGMKDSDANEHPESFNKADLDEAVGKLVAIMRRTKPQVVMTYSDDQRGYPHPDHVKVHDITLPAFERAGDPAWYPEAGEPWRPSKLYYTVWSKSRMVAVHKKMLDVLGESPFDEKWLERPDNDHRITTRIDVRDYLGVRRAALLAHATQVDPNERFWFGLSDDHLAEVYPYEDWELAKSEVGSPAAGQLEDDLFAGIRERVG